MKILQIHNRYKDLGGEDVVVAREKAMLEEAGHIVIQFIVSNEEIEGFWQKTTTALSLSYSIKYKRHIENVIKRHSPNIAHIHNFLPILSPSIFKACKNLKVPVVLTVHNYRLVCSNGLLYRDGKICEECLTKKIGWPAVKHGCYQDSKVASIFPVIHNAVHSNLNTWSKYIDKVIFLTEFSKSIFERSHLTFRSEQMVIKPNFVADRGYCLEKEDYYLFVGRLSQEKGILEVIEAFAELAHKLVIVGTGPLEKNVEKAALENDNIEYLGFQSQEELSHLYMKAKALIVASKVYETFGLTVVEAFSFGTPVIAPDFGNLGSFIKEKGNGLKYKLGDLSSLRNTIGNFEMIIDKIKIDNEARLTFEGKYTTKKNLESLLKIYREVVN